MLKRLFDIFTSFSLLVFLFPVALIVSFLIYLNLGSPIIFSQLRPGKDGVPFRMFKFRSMKVAPNIHDALNDADRLTKFGIWLRKTSLDELPSLFNILKGDMSFVGPRPLLIQYLPYYTLEEQQRHDVRPGLTGWAQVNGRNNLSWEDRFKLDIWYVNNKSFWLDIKIVFLTIKKVLKSDDVIADPRSVMLNFDEERKKNVD